MSSTYRQKFYELAMMNHGVVSTALAAGSGIPTVELRKLASRKAIHRVAQGVYRSPFHPKDLLSRVSEALAIAGPGSFVIGVSVLSLIGISDLDLEVVSVGTTKRLRKKVPAQILIEHFNLTPELEIINDFPCQSLSAVMRHIANTAAPEDYAAVAMQLRRMGLIS